MASRTSSSVPPQMPDADGRRRHRCHGARRWRQCLEYAVNALAGPGWGVLDDFLPPGLWQALAQDAMKRFHQGAFRNAGIGTQGRIRRRIRGDAIHWLDLKTATGPLADFYQRIEALRQTLNRQLWLGLAHYECHYARYPVGAGYQRHRDRVQGDDQRTVTLITYLNEDWQPWEGGALRIHPQPGEPLEILPVGGRAVLFLTEELEHEVLPARRPRLSLTGWFRRRPMGGLPA